LKKWIREQESNIRTVLKSGDFDSEYIQRQLDFMKELSRQQSLLKKFNQKDFVLSFDIVKQLSNLTNYSEAEHIPQIQVQKANAKSNVEEVVEEVKEKKEVKKEGKKFSINLPRLTLKKIGKERRRERKNTEKEQKVEEKKRGEKKRGRDIADILRELDSKYYEILLE